MSKYRELGGLESNIWKLYALKAVYAFLLLTPVIVLFWQENGLNMTQVMVLQALYAVAVVLLEVPTGYISDIYGRRNALLLSGVFATLGMSAYALGHNFFEFLVGEIVWAVGLSLLSGTDSALMYDTLVELDREGEYQRIWGDANSIYMISAGVASVAGGFIGSFNLRWTLYAQVPVIALVIPISFFLREPRHYRDLKEKESQGMKEILRGAFVNDSKLRTLMIYGALIYAFLQAGFWLYQPYFKLTGLQVAKFGVVFASFNVVSALASKYAHDIESLIGKKLSLVSLTLLAAFSFMLMGSFVTFLGIGFILLQQFVRGFSKPVISDYVNQLTSSDRRSTVLSAQSLLGRLFMSVLMPLTGLVSDVYSVPQAFGALAITLGVLGSAVILLLGYEKVF